MATTLQTQQSTAPNPQLKRLVYSKYREMLGSYNDKANTIIQSLPKYMVKEDKGFNFDCINDLTNGNSNDIVDCNDSERYGAPPALPPGSIPAQRLPSQCTPNNPPACVQNAMMTKDKKPFTYTPSGIDLSQIKSDRMAKRLARNAQMEGVGTNPKQNPYAQQALQQQQHSPGLAQSSLGMPVQVFPTGPPPPPPPQPKGKAGGPGGIPPPPPPQQPSKNQLAPQTNGAAARKSPSPQNFEPPPFGCRPEIKIPPNPMAALKKVPKPVEKNDFWIEEYRKDRSKSPMVENNGAQSYANQPQDNYNYVQGQQNSPSPPAPVVQQQQQPRAPSPMRSPPVSQYQQPQQNQQSPLRSPAVNQTQLYDQNRGPSPLKSSAINQAQQYEQNRGQSPLKSPAINQTQQYDQNRGQSPIKSPAIAQIQSQYQQQARQQSPIRTFPGGQINQNRVESPFQSPQDNPNLQRPLSPVRVNQQQQTPTYNRSPGLTSSPPEQQTPRNAVGSLYIPPVAPENLATKQQVLSNQQQVLANQQQQLHQQQLQQQQLQQQQLQQEQLKADRKGPPPNRWISAQPTKDVPDWARQNDTTKQQQSPQLTRPQQVTPPSQSPPIRNNGHQQQQQQQPGQQQQQQPQPKLNHMQQQNPGLRLQMNNNGQSAGSNPREHIIPIQLEQTPTPTRSPATPGFGPQPYQNSNQHFSSVSSPSGGNSPGYVIRNPNQFVDQGYNNYGVTQQQSPVQQISSSSQTGGSRVVPMRVEGQDSPFNSNNVRGPLSQSPMVMQNDPRTLQHQNSWVNNGTGPSNGPNQSKSFRILQKITDTEGNDDNLSSHNSTSSSSSLSAVAVNSTNNKQINDNNYDQLAQLQRPQYSRQMSTTSGIGNGVNNNHQQQQYIDNQTEQMRRMQISNNDQEYMNRVRNHVDEDNTSTNIAELKSHVSSIPSDQIHILQDILDRKLKEDGLNIGDDNDTTTLINDIQTNGTPPVMHQALPPRYVQQRPYQFNEDQYQQYVHPSEQQVPEPKIYTGSAIPSRSFKLLQAMTTPENAAEMEGSGVVDYEQISNMPYPPYPPYPYPYGYPYPPPYPYPPIDPNNWPYPHPPPLSYPPVPPYFYYYPEYDSQNYHNDPYSNKSHFQRHRSLSQERFRDYRRDTRRDSAPPNIIVTPSFDEAEENRFDEDQERIAQQNRNIRAKSTLNSISERLNKINNTDCMELNISKEADKTYVGERQKRVTSTPSPNNSSSADSTSPITNERSVIENNEIHTTNIDTDSSSSEDEDEEFDEIKPLEHFWGKTNKTDLQNTKKESTSDDDREECKQNYRKAIDFFRTQTNSIDIVLSANDTIISKTENKSYTNKPEMAKPEISNSSEDDSEKSDSESESEKEEKADLKLKAVKSVNNIQMYNENDEETTIEDGSKVFDGEDTEIEEELTDDDTEIIEESPEEEETDNDEDIQEHIIQDSLSVIYEESEGGASNRSKTIVRQNSESLSEASTTIGNDKEEKEEELTDNNIEDENSVTVRLPLRLSFSKSSNDENITTVEVGNSEIEDQTKSFSIASISIDNDDEGDYSDDPNVSVTLSLSSSPSGSFDKPECFRTSFPIDKIKEENKSDNEDDDDVSVSFSLSMRNKFLQETFGGDLTNDIAIEAETKDEDEMNTEVSDIETEEEQDNENEEVNSERKDDEISLLLSPSYKNIWQSFGTTLKDIATKEGSAEGSGNTNDVNTTSNLGNSADDVEDFWATIKESRKREATPDFWASLKENKDEIIIEPIDEDDEIVESILDSDDVENIAEVNRGDSNVATDDFWSSMEKSKRALNDIKNNFNDFWGSAKDTEEKIMRNQRAVSEFCGSTVQENFSIDTKLNKEQASCEDVDDFWESQNKDGNESDNSEEKRINYRKAMEFFRNKRESSLPIKQSADLVRTGENKDQFHDISKNFDSIPNKQNLQNSTQRSSCNESGSYGNMQEKQYKEVPKEEESDEEVTEEEDEEETEDEDEIYDEGEEQKYYEGRKYSEDVSPINVVDQILREQLEEEEESDDGVREEAEEIAEEEEEEEEEEDDTEEDEEEDDDEEEEQGATELIEKTINCAQEITPHRFISNPAYTSNPTNMCPTYYSPPIYQHEDSPFIFNECKAGIMETYTDSIDTSEADQKRSVRDKIMAFESGKIDNSDSKLKLPFTSPNTTENIKNNICRTNSLQRSESELEEDDSGVTDMSKHISETDTESECFPELRKMTSYQRAATHSRLFKLLQEQSDASECDNVESSKDEEEEKRIAEEFNLRPSRKKIIHNVSITRRNNPDGLKDVESMSQRRQRLSLPLTTSNSIDSDNLSTSNSPTNSNSNSRHNVSDQLVNELVQSLLLKKNTSHLKNLPMEKLKAAAKRVLEEDLDSLENTSLESTPALTPQEFKTDSYTEYYDTWDANTSTVASLLNEDFEIVPSKSLKVLQEQSISGKRKPWGVRCPRVLSSKTINRDLTRVSESPENFRASSMIRSSTERDSENRYNRASSITRRKL